VEEATTFLPGCDCVDEAQCVPNLPTEAILGFQVLHGELSFRAVDPGELVGWVFKSWRKRHFFCLFAAAAAFFLSFFFSFSQTWRDVFGYEISLWVF
jgi:hypothetical protein